MALQFIRGLDADRLNLTPAAGEPLFTTDTKKLYIGDGSTAGGLEVTGTDSASIIALIQQTAIDSAAVLSLIEANNTDSAEITSIVNPLYIQARQSYNATTLGGHDSAYFLNYFNFTNTPNVLDSANIVSIVDSAYIAARTPPSLTIREVDSADNVNKTITNVSAINFDNWTGFQVSDLGNGEVKVALGSGFKTITVSGQDDIVAIGEDTLTLEAGTGITLTTDAVTKALTITAATDSAYVAAQVSTAINNLVDAAPAALDTLNELAAALGDDANFATTVTNSIATKLATADFDATFDSALSTKTTDDVTEGSTNLYYTDARVTTLVDSAYVQARQLAQDFTYASLTGAPNVLDSADVTALIEANSANVVVSGTAPASPAEGDLWYDNVTTGQLYTYVGTSWLSTAGLTTLEFSSVGDLSDVDITTTAPANGEALVWDSANSKFVPGVTFSQADFDSAFNGKTTDDVTEGSTNLYYTDARVTTLVDSAYVQTRQTPQDFAYASLTGAPTNVSSFTNDAGYITAADALDSSEAQALIDASINALVDAAPAALDTLNELAAALGDDANFATTVTNALAALPDSAEVVGLVTSTVDSAYVQARQTPQDFAYSSLTGAPTNVSSFTNDAGYTTYDSASTIGLVDSAYVQARQTAQDFAYSSLTGTPNVLDSADVTALIEANSANVVVSGTAPSSPAEGDLWYDNVTTGQLYTYVGTSWLSTAGLTTLEFSSIADLSDVDSAAPTNGQYLAWDSASSKYVPTTLDAGTDSATVTSIVTSTVDAAYVQARQTPQDFAYSSLTGAPTNVSSFSNDAGYTTYDSANTVGLVDSAYIQARQTPQDFAYSSLTGAPTAVSSFTNDANYIATNDSAILSALSTTGNLIVGGNLQVNGTTVTVNSTNLDVTDNMIYLNAGESAGSPTASIDVGWAANVNDDGSYAHVGFFRDATDNTFKVYQGYSPEPDAAVQIDTSHASFALAPFAASTLTGQYLGFDSDVTAAGLATQSYVGTTITTVVDSAYINARVAAGTDSATVATIVEGYGYTTTTVSGTNPVSPNEGDLWYDDSDTGLLYIYENSVWTAVSIPPLAAFDSADAIGLIDSAYINARVAAGTDSSTVINLVEATVDSAYVSNLFPVGGSSTVIVPVAFAHITLNNYTANSGTGISWGTYQYSAGNYGYYQFTFDTAQPNANYSVLTDMVVAGDTNISPEVTNRTTTGFRVNFYDNNGTELQVSSVATYEPIIQVYGSTPYQRIAGLVGGYLDSADTVTLITSTVDSAYVQSRQDFAYGSLTGAPTLVSSFTNDAGYLTTAIDSTGVNGLITTAINNLVDAAPAALDTLNELAAALGDDANFATTVTNAIAALPDSAEVATIVTSYGYTTFDSADAIALIDSAYINARVAAGTDSATVVSIINATVDSAYVNALITLDATVSVSGTAPVSPNEGDLWYDNVTTGQLYTYVGTSWLSTAGLTTLEFSSIADLSDVDSSAPTNGQYLAWDSASAKYVPTTLAAGTDSATVAAIVTSTVDSAYVQARQTAQDFAYASLTGAPTNVSSFTNDAGYLTTAIDSAGVAAIVTSYGYTTFDSAAASSLITTAINNLVDAAPAALDTLNELAAALGDDANFATTVTNAIAALPDSAEVATIVTSYGYTTFDSSNVIGLVDSAYVQARQTPQDFAYSSLTGAPTNVSSFTNDAGYLTTAIDSAGVASIVTSYGYTTYDSADFTGQLTAATGTSVQAYDANLTSFVSAFTLPTADGTTGQVLVTNGSGTLSFADQSGGGGGGLDSAAVITLISANASGSSVTVSSTAPLSPSEGDLWYDNTTTGELFVYEGGAWTTTAVADVDSAEVAAIVADKLQYIDIGDIVGADGNPGEVLQSNGNGNSSWVDMKLIARQKAFAVSLIFS